MPILRLERVSKRYGSRLVFADVNLRLKASDFILLVGPNGSGKTTLLRILSSYSSPSSGRVAWEAAPGKEPPSAELARMGVGTVAHHPLLYDELTAKENLEFVLRVHRLDQAEARAERWLEAFGLEGRANERVASFSRGLKQRLALARAFAVEPHLLLLDEPATALDERGLENLVDQLTKIRERAAVVLATHEPDPFRPLATRTLEIRDRTVHDWGGTP